MFVGRSIVVALALAVSGAGCGQPKFKTTYPVQGHVLFNGKPIGGVKVVLLSVDDKDDQPVRPTGTVDESGRFVLSTYANGDGAPAGSYKVTVVTPLPEPKGQAGQKPLPRQPEPTSKVPARYSNPDTSGLTVVVEPRENDLPINLTR